MIFYLLVFATDPFKTIVLSSSEITFGMIILIIFICTCDLIGMINFFVIYPLYNMVVPTNSILSPSLSYPVVLIRLIFKMTSSYLIGLIILVFILSSIDLIGLIKFIVQPSSIVLIVSLIWTDYSRIWTNLLN